MICIFCGNENISNENTVDAGNIVFCNTCNGKYSVKGKSKGIIDYPKHTIHQMIPVILLIASLPAAYIWYLMEMYWTINMVIKKIFLMVLISVCL